MALSRRYRNGGGARFGRFGRFARFSRIARSTAGAAPTASALSYGTVTAQVQKGKTTQIDLLQAFSGPNISTTDREGVETWVYERTGRRSPTCRATRSRRSSCATSWACTSSAGTVHNVHAAPAELTGVINGVVDLSPIEVGLHDEIFQGGQPVLAGVDAASTYCYLLEAVEHRDADTWGVHLLEASAQGLDPKCTVADSGSGLRAGQQQAWPDTPCHGDVFHIQHQIEGVANTLARIVQGHTTRCKALQAPFDKGHRRDRKRDLLG